MRLFSMQQQRHCSRPATRRAAFRPPSSAGSCRLWHPTGDAHRRRRYAGSGGGALVGARQVGQGRAFRHGAASAAAVPGGLGGGGAAHAAVDRVLPPPGASAWRVAADTCVPLPQPLYVYFSSQRLSSGVSLCSASPGAYARCVGATSRFVLMRGQGQRSHLDCLVNGRCAAFSAQDSRCVRLWQPPACAATLRCT